MIRRRRSSVGASLPPGALVVHPSVKANTLAEFIAEARANPGKITSATQGNGTTSHLT
ncbi:MAG: tripartite tricarboxylate transporter substrate-binding protein, partial [Xanthobacteraceae bacterium]